MSKNADNGAIRPDESEVQRTMSNKTIPYWGKAIGFLTFGALVALIGGVLFLRPNILQMFSEPAFARGIITVFICTSSDLI